VIGNQRLTAATAIVLLILLAAEGATIPFIGQLVGPHIFIGVLLIPPVLMKLGSTGYRFVATTLATAASAPRAPRRRCCAGLHRRSSH